MGKIASNAVRDAARGEECTLNIAGVCNYRVDTTVFCHFPDESNGWGAKSDDLSGGFGCSACHDVIDRRNNKVQLTAEDREFYMRRSMVRTWRRLLQKKVFTIKGVAA
ncbi:hypothetical protein IPC102_09545 [Pseudomonas aeruginosa]|uniref:DUF1364 domain-containing protein n=1 Tax=Pseudomonas aeruginosa TaxID=287 RepID=UPI000F548CCD|nr:DUF1364 domain-containing protein [Pseudomonas aeruginosa]RQH70005.1 hypothetical protein IPC102_09545 [Pseudomonas aeruginosa]